MSHFPMPNQFTKYKILALQTILPPTNKDLCFYPEQRSLIKGTNIQLSEVIKQTEHLKTYLQVLRLQTLIKLRPILKNLSIVG
jgi:hypothetical protein